MHQSKIEDINYVNNYYLKNKISYEVKTYFSDIQTKLKKAALVICRAGASTISENLVSGLPAIYVPLSKSVDNHQKHNAEIVTIVAKIENFSIFIRLARVVYLFESLLVDN